MTTPEPAEMKPKRRCIDGGACHHECEPQYCFRKETSLPLSASGLGDDWESKTDDPPAAPVAEDAVSAMAKAITAANDAVLSAEDCQDYNFAAMISKSLADQGFTIAPIAQPVADETAARCGDAQPGSKPDNSIPGAAVLDEKLREAMEFIEENGFDEAEAWGYRNGQSGVDTLDTRKSKKFVAHWATIEAALAELAALRTKQQWQPIDTMPDSLDNVDLFCTYMGKPYRRYLDCKRDKQFNRWYFECPEMGWQPVGGGGIQITHYCVPKLPTPPAAGGV